MATSLETPKATWVAIVSKPMWVANKTPKVAYHVNRNSKIDKLRGGVQILIIELVGCAWTTGHEQYKAPHVLYHTQSRKVYVG
jgi:hypothetical protein